jgi:hypothetical protein
MNIEPDRLANDGFGASRPVESNDTLEDRARNRRVELVRQSLQRWRQYVLPGLAQVEPIGKIGQNLGAFPCTIL